VLTVDDLGAGTRGGGLFMSYLARKEKLATPTVLAASAVVGIPGIP
jgi:hypothetical protein